jgi:flavin-dependent dehydrogenase
VSGSPDMRLDTGSRVAVIGGGPAGSLFSYFLMSMGERIGIEPRVDIYEPKDYSRPGPAGCNMCGGIISETLVQLLTTEGINLPTTVVQRGIESYVLHMDVGSVRIEPPRKEKRIAAIHRGAGPRGIAGRRWESFDGHLLELASAKGASVVGEQVDSVEWTNGKPRVVTKSGVGGEYDLLVGAVGVNSPFLKYFESLDLGYLPPGTAKTWICEFFLGEETIRSYFGSSMHIFLLNLPPLEFAAIIPKGDYVTVCLLGEGIDAKLVESFLFSQEVKKCFPPGWSVPADFCRCAPSINISGATMPFSDRVVFVGDAGVSRLYKDGIGGAYRTAKSAAKTALFEGISADDFRKHYLPVCRALNRDNQVGKVIFLVTRLIQGLRIARRGVLRMTTAEQGGSPRRQRMSGVLWDTFTGSAPYRDVFLRTLSPAFLGRLAYATGVELWPVRRCTWRKEAKVELGGLGKIYKPGEIIVRQGDPGDCMYVVQSGKVEVIKEKDGKEVRLAELVEGDFFGEMALFEKGAVRSATVRPVGEVRVLSVDKKVFLRKIHDDPSLAFRILQKMAGRIRELNNEMVRFTIERQGA